MSLFLIPPAVVKKAPNVLEIRKATAVIGMLFIPKTSQEDTANWAARKSINFKLLDVGKLLYVEPGKGKSSVISTHSQSKNYPQNTPQLSKEFTIIDNTKNETITMVLK